MPFGNDCREASSLRIQLPTSEIERSTSCQPAAALIIGATRFSALSGAAEGSLRGAISGHIGSVPMCNLRPCADWLLPMSAGGDSEAESHGTPPPLATLSNAHELSGESRAFARARFAHPKQTISFGESP
jgi:hypothetical protein